MKHRIHMARTGRFRAGNGEHVTIDEDLLKTLADGYDPAVFRAPLVLGHPEDGAPAYGWIDRLIVEGGNLYGEASNVAPELQDAVKKESYRNVSISYWPKGDDRSPASDRPYFRHLGILGAQAPAIKGLAPLAFDEDAPDGEGAVTVDLGEEERAPAPAPDPAPITETPPEKDIDMTKEPEKTPEQRAAEFAEREAALAAREAKLAEAEAAAEAKRKADADEARRAAAVSFADGLIREGRMLPAGRDGVIEIHRHLAAAPEPLEFADGMKAPAVKAFESLFTGAKKMIELGEVAKDGDAQTVDLNAPGAVDAIYDAALDLQKQKPHLAFSECVRAVEEGVAK